MHEDCLPNWDELASCWEAFEQRGFTPANLGMEVEKLAPPIGVLGCGRGVFLSYLQRSFSEGQVYGYDASPEMVRLARQNGHSFVELVSTQNPIPEGHKLGSIMVATGVLDPMENDEIIALLERLRSRVMPQGQLVMSCFGRRGPLDDLARQCGAVAPLGIRWGPILDACEQRYSEPTDPATQPIRQWVDKIAEVRGGPWGENLAWLRRVLPKIRRQFSLTQVIEFLRVARFEVVEASELVHDGVIVAHARKPV